MVINEKLRMILQFVDDRRNEVLEIRVPEVGLLLIRVELDNG